MFCTFTCNWRKPFLKAGSWLCLRFVLSSYFFYIFFRSFFLFLFSFSSYFFLSFFLSFFSFFPLAFSYFLFKKERKCFQCSDFSGSNYVSQNRLQNVLSIFFSSAKMSRSIWSQAEGHQSMYDWLTANRASLWSRKGGARLNGWKEYWSKQLLFRLTCCDSGLRPHQSTNTMQL